VEWIDPKSRHYPMVTCENTEHCAETNMQL